MSMDRGRYVVPFLGACTRHSIAAPPGDLREAPQVEAVRDTTQLKGLWRGSR